MSLHDKHRQRLDKKVCEHGLDTIEAHEQLEHLLFAVIPRGDTNGIAHRLLDRYMTLGAVINADPKELETIQGVGHRTAMFLTSLPSLLGIVERCTKIESSVELYDLQDITNFVKTYFYGKLNEEVYMFSLNSAYRILAVHRVSEGVAGEVYVFPTRLVKQAILDNASAVIVAHNHPGGKVNPSMGDINISKKLFKAFEAVDIEFRDSIVISGDLSFSMRDYGYFDYEKKDYNGNNIGDKGIFVGRKK